MRSIIIDDEQNNIENLQIILREHCPQVKIVATATNVDEGEKLIQLHQPDLLFLDIQMPDKNGFDLLKSLHHTSFEVIFVTGYDKYGIQAIRFSAIDYLLKPIVLADLKAAIGRAENKISEKKKNEQLENLIQFLQQKNDKQEHRIALPSAKETRFVHPSEIIYCEAKNNYTLFHLQPKEQLLIAKPLYEYEELLNGYGFVRCHNSYLVNKHYVKSMLKEDGGALLMFNDARIPVSRQRRENIKSELLKK